MCRLVCWLVRLCGIDLFDEVIYLFGLLDGYFLEIWNFGFFCLLYYEKYNENNGLRGFGNLVLIL